MKMNRKRKRPRDLLEPLVPLLAELQGVHDTNTESENTENLRKKLRLLLELAEHELRADLELVSTRFPDGARLPLWPVSQFGKKRVFGSVHFYADHVSVGPVRRVPEDYAAWFGSLWSDKSQMARSETDLRFDHRLPFSQWEPRAQQLPIKTWAQFVRQEAQVREWARSVPRAQVAAFTWDAKTRSPQPSYTTSLADVAFSLATATTLGCAFVREMHTQTPAVQLSVRFADIEEAVNTWLAELRALLGGLLLAPLVDLVLAYREEK